MRIYLAGGMRLRPTETFQAALKAAVACNGPLVRLAGLKEIAWTELVRDVLSPGHEVFEPRMNHTKVFEDYSFLDLLELRRSELIIAYLEESNPSGAGLVAECAYAKGQGKTVLLINEKDDRYLKFVENFADRVFHRLEDAVPLIARIRP